ncbi:hypothetical protein THRCLA_20163 [Thraustotheca clavata]|uniref:RanBP2-type domain-containing protein n=1 Tax=Thraustotheca clavata TaxID=74557 RepID=A0A1W0AAS6_9STRA|nr:hypothetical protein THRCLA_20163 [Thraustotheca clavata]
MDRKRRRDSSPEHKERKKSNKKQKKRLKNHEQDNRDEHEARRHEKDQVETKKHENEQKRDENEEETKKTTTKDFFEMLKQQEAVKERVGTIHTSGKKTEVVTVTDNWECIKPGCGHSNMKKATACTKCGAMRRISAWR